MTSLQTRHLRLQSRAPFRWLLVIVALFALIAGLYAPSLFGPMFVDDDIYVFGNVLLQKASLWQVLTERMNIYEFLPLRDASYWLDWQLFGNKLIPYRVHNWLWYASATLAASYAAYHLWLLVARDPEPALPFAVLVAVFFVLNPLHVESVAWIAGRKDIMAGTFAFLSLAFWARALSGNNVRMGLAALALYSMATLSKTPTMVMPGILVLMWWCYATNRKNVGFGVLLLGFMAVCAASFWMSVGNAGEVGVLSAARANTPWGDRIHFALRIFGESIRRSLIPVDLRLIYDHLFLWASPAEAWLAAALGLAGVLGTMVALVAFLRRPHIFTFGVLWFALFMVPYLQLTPFKAFSPFSDRYVFVGSFGLAVIYAGIIQTHVPHRFRKGLVLGLMAILMALTFWRSLDWRSIETLVAKEASSTVGSTGALGLAISRLYLPQQRYAEAEAAANRMFDPAKRLEAQIEIEFFKRVHKGDKEALREFIQHAVVDYLPSIIETMGLAIAMSQHAMQMGLLDEAERLYRAMLDDRGFAEYTKGDVLHNLALVMQKRGDLEGALQTYRKAATMPQRNRAVRAVSWIQVGKISAALGRPDDAHSAFSEALTLDPTNDVASRQIKALENALGR